MSSYIRFHTSLRCPDTGRPLGVFQCLDDLEEHIGIESYSREALNEIVGWFDLHLQAPRILPKHQLCVFWFCDRHQSLISRLWDLIAIIRLYDVEVGMLRTEDPGMVVYRDEHQVAAVPNARIRRELASQAI